MVKSELPRDLAVSAFELKELPLVLEDPATELKESALERNVSPANDFPPGDGGTWRESGECSAAVVEGERSSSSPLFSGCCDCDMLRIITKVLEGEYLRGDDSRQEARGEY